MSLQFRSMRPPCVHRAPPARPRQAGFTLIEVLVAILVLSFGMLGVVGLQVSAMQANRGAKNQSAGVRYARELAESMRANKTEIAKATNAYLIDSLATTPDNFNCRSNSASAPVCANHGDLAKQDMRDWWNRASVELTGLRVVVCPDAAPYDASGKAQWACTPPASTSAGQSLFIKLGWTQQSLDRSATTTAFTRATSTGADAAIPLVVVPVVN